MRARMRTTVAALAAVGLVVAACGGDDDEPAAEPAEPADEPAEPAEEPAEPAACETPDAVSVADEASFPGATHDVVFPLSAPLPTGSYTLLADLDYGGGTVLLGEALVEVP